MTFLISWWKEAIWSNRCYKHEQKKVDPCSFRNKLIRQFHKHDLSYNYIFQAAYNNLNRNYHENNISNLRVTGCMDQLLHNFSRRQVAFEAHCSGGTESAAHLAPHLFSIIEAKSTPLPRMWPDYHDSYYSVVYKVASRSCSRLNYQKHVYPVLKHLASNIYLWWHTKSWAHSSRTRLSIILSQSRVVSHDHCFYRLPILVYKI
jgi:hypothetical protein